MDELVFGFKNKPKKPHLDADVTARKRGKPDFWPKGVASNMWGGLKLQLSRKICPVGGDMGQRLAARWGKSTKKHKPGWTCVENDAFTDRYGSARCCDLFTKWPLTVNRFETVPYNTRQNLHIKHCSPFFPSFPPFSPSPPLTCPPSAGGASFLLKGCLSPSFQAVVTAADLIRRSLFYSLIKY